MIRLQFGKLVVPEKAVRFVLTGWRSQVFVGISSEEWSPTPVEVNHCTVHSRGRRSHHATLRSKRLAALAHVGIIGTERDLELAVVDAEAGLLEARVVLLVTVRHSLFVPILD